MLASQRTPPAPCSSSATRRFRFCVPDEWYRRTTSISRSLSSSSLDEGESTIRDHTRMDDDGESDKEDTAKVVERPQHPSVESIFTSPPSPPLPDASKNRLSTLFDSWLHSPPPASSPTTSSGRDSRHVSEPMLVDTSRGGTIGLKGGSSAGMGFSVPESNEDAETYGHEIDVDPADFEKMMNELGLKDAQRQAMHQLPSDRKRYLLRQNHQFRPSAGSRPPVSPSTRSSIANSQTYGPTSAVNLLPRLVPQLTGDSIMKRFSISGWGGSATTTSPALDPTHAEGSNARGRTSFNTENAFIQPQTTGGLWSSWWASSGGAKELQVNVQDKNLDEANSVEFYVDGMRTG